jgi:hypothetical protein
MKQRVHARAGSIHLGHQRIEQERRVVIDGDEHSLAPRELGHLRLEFECRDEGFARFANGRLREDQSRESRQRFRRVAREVFRRGAPIERIEKRCETGLGGFQDGGCGREFGDGALFDVMGVYRIVAERVGDR